jgi:hypothetical protein
MIGTICMSLKQIAPDVTISSPMVQVSVIQINPHQLATVILSRLNPQELFNKIRFTIYSNALIIST